MVLKLKNLDIKCYLALIIIIIILSRLSYVFAMEMQIPHPYEKLIENEDTSLNADQKVQEDVLSKLNSVSKAMTLAPLDGGGGHCSPLLGLWQLRDPDITHSVSSSDCNSVKVFATTSLVNEAKSSYVDFLLSLSPKSNHSLQTQSIDFFRNSTTESNCAVAPVLESSRTKCTLRFCAPWAPSTCYSLASFERSLINAGSGSEVGLAAPSGQSDKIQSDIAPDSVSNFEELVVALEVNFVNTGIVATALKTHTNDILVPLEDLNGFGIKSQYLALGAATIAGTNYINLRKLPNTVYKYDEENLILAVNFPPIAMPMQNINVWSESHRQNETFGGTPIKAFYINYDLTSTRQERQYYTAGIQEFNYAYDENVITQTIFAKKNFYGKRDANAVRLETSWTIDNDIKMSKWKFGDSITQSADWSSSTRFAGIQYTSDFSLNPNLVTYPLINFSGRADLPTALDIYANSHLLYKTELKTGDFIMDNLPVSAGRGAVEIKQQDITGKIQTITIPYYVAPTLLKEGLKDYSYEIGTQRTGYGTFSNKYRYLVTSFDFNKGMNSNWTAGAHFESMKNIFAAGVSSLYKVGTYGVFSGSIATSGPKLSNAQKLLLGYSFQSRFFGLGIQQVISGKNFLNTFNLDNSGIERATQGSISYALTEKSSIGLSYIRAISRSQDEKNLSEMIMANYQNSISKNATILFSIGTDMANKGSTFVSLSFGYNLGHHSVSSTVYKEGRSWIPQIGIASNTINNNDLTYRANFSKDKDWSYDTQVDKRMEKARATLYLFNYANVPIQQVSLTGAVAATGQGVFFSRTINDSFVLAKVGNFKDVKVSHNNQYIGKTDKNGLIFIPKVPSYINSKISIDEETLPLSANFTDNIFIVNPKRKSGVFAKFDIVKMRVGEITLLDANNVALDQDMDVKIDGVEEELFIGYDGKLYIPDLHDLTHINGSACNKEQKCCKFSISLEGTENEEIIDLGVQKCE